MRLLLPLTILCALTVMALGGFAAAPSQAGSAIATGIISFVDPHSPDKHHDQSEHCSKAIGTQGCSSSAPVLAIAGGWQPLRIALSYRQATETRPLNSLALRPPKRPPRLA